MIKILSQKIKKLPQKPGTYLFIDASGRIIYIGKAIDLKKRVQSHFSKKSAFYGIPFIDKVSDIDWIKTKNEAEAMLLEDQLIKKYKPRYNIQWKDDKSYFWVTFTQDEWPRVTIVHKPQVASDKQLTIGSFVNGRELRATLRALRKIFPYRTCKNPYDKPCLQWHLGLCPAHRSPALPAGRLGEGGPAHDTDFKLQASRQRRGSPEVASYRLKKYLNSLNALSQFLHLYAGEPIRIEAYDISNIQGKYATGSMIVFYGTKREKSDYRKFRIKTVQGANDVAMIREVLKRRFKHPEWSYPDLMLIDGGKTQLSAAKFIIHDSKFMIPIIALAKREEEIYTEYSGNPLGISRLPQSLRLIFQHIRDEAHRFAIFYYRYLHEKQGFGKSHREIRKTRSRQR